MRVCIKLYYACVCERERESICTQRQAWVCVNKTRLEENIPLLTSPAPVLLPFTPL